MVKMSSTAWTTLCVAFVLSACNVRNPDVCCTTPDSCTEIGETSPLECASDRKCVDMAHLCVLSTCGDGVVDVGESCDDGNNVDGDGCSADCQTPTCLVPVTHPTIQAAIDDAFCASVTVSPGTYYENINVDRALTLRGTSMPAVLDGSASGPVVTNSANLTIVGLGISNGKAEAGGGILNHGTLTLSDVTVSSNVALSAFARGGGIFSDGPLSLIHSEVSGNQAISNGIADGTLDISPEKGARASGGGIYSTGSINVLDSQIVDNQASFSSPTAGGTAEGGGIAAEGAEVVLTSTKLMRNRLVADGHPGKAYAFGGGIYASASVTLMATELRANETHASGAYATSRGGGVFADRLSISGGAIADSIVDVTVDNASIEVSGGGGGWVRGAVSAQSAVIQGNQVKMMSPDAGIVGKGGGFTIEGHETSSVVAVDLIENGITLDGVEHIGAGGGISWLGDAAVAGGRLEVTSSTLGSNTIAAAYATGVGLDLEYPSSGVSARVYGSSIISNACTAVESCVSVVSVVSNAANGANDVAIVNSTLSNNIGNHPASLSAIAARQASGAGILRVKLRSATIVSNAGGLYLENNAAVDLANTIFTANNPVECSRYQNATLTSYGNNIIGDMSGCSPTSLGVDITSTVPKLNGLANNGGPTQTQSLQAGSPAIDAGTPGGCVDEAQVVLQEDQRGMPRTNHGRCDIGAYEQ